MKDCRDLEARTNKALVEACQIEMIPVEPKRCWLQYQDRNECEYTYLIKDRVYCNLFLYKKERGIL